MENLPRDSTKGGNQSDDEEFLRSNAPLFLLVASRRFRHSPWFAFLHREPFGDKKVLSHFFQSSRVHKTINLYPFSVYMVRNLLLGDWEVYTANQQMTIEWLQRWTARYMCLQILHFYLIHGFQNFSIESVSHWQIQKFVEGEAIGARYKWNFLRSNMKR